MVLSTSECESKCQYKCNNSKNGRIGLQNNKTATKNNCDDPDKVNFLKHIKCDLRFIQL